MLSGSICLGEILSIFLNSGFISTLRRLLIVFLSVILFFPTVVMAEKFLAPEHLAHLQPVEDEVLEGLDPHAGGDQQHVGGLDAAP